MEKRNIISALKDEQFVRYFVRNRKLDYNGRKIMSFLRKKACRHLLMNLIENPGMTNKDLASAICLSPSTASWHLNKLVAVGLVKKTVRGRESNFEVIDPENIAELIITYRGSFFDKLLDNFIEMWELECKKDK